MRTHREAVVTGSRPGLRGPGGGACRGLQEQERRSEQERAGGVNKERAAQAWSVECGVWSVESECGVEEREEREHEWAVECPERYRRREKGHQPEERGRQGG
eukprot:129269-Rhodomonas_salina.2